VAPLVECEPVGRRNFRSNPKSEISDFGWAIEIKNGREEAVLNCSESRCPTEVDGMAFFGITSLGPPNIFDLYRWPPRA
jgi:hypothetical protein